MSLLEIARLFRRDRGTVLAWIDRGCPTVRRADRPRGVSWLLDPADVLAWREQDLRERGEVPAAKEANGIPDDGLGQTPEERLGRIFCESIVQILDRTVPGMLLALVEDEGLSPLAAGRTLAWFHGLIGLEAQRWARGEEGALPASTFLRDCATERGERETAAGRVAARMLAETHERLRAAEQGEQRA